MSRVRYFFGTLVGFLAVLIVPSFAQAQTTSVTIGVGDTTVRITGGASPGALVTFLVDGVVTGSTTADTAGDYSYVLTDQASGVHTFEAFAKDASGRLSDTIGVEASVAKHMQTELELFLPPTLRLSENQVAQGGTVTVEGMTVANAQVVIHIDDSYVTAVADAAGFWRYIIDTTVLEPGEHRLYVVAVQGNGEQSRPTQNRIFIVDPLSRPSENDTDGPLAPGPVQEPAVPSVDNPKTGTTVNTDEVEFSGKAEPGVQIEIWNQDHPVGSVFVDADGIWRIRISLTEPANEFKVRACRQDVCSPFSSVIQIYYARPPAFSKALAVALDGYRFNVRTDAPVALRAFITGGMAPYELFVDWGDGSKESLSTDRLMAAFQHTYGREGSYNGTVTAVDKNGQHSAAHFSVLTYTNAPGVPTWVWPTTGVALTFVFAFVFGGYRLLGKLMLRLGWHIRVK